MEPIVIVLAVASGLLIMHLCDYNKLSTIGGWAIWLSAMIFSIAFANYGTSLVKLEKKTTIHYDVLEYKNILYSEPQTVKEIKTIYPGWSIKSDTTEYESKTQGQ